MAAFHRGSAQDSARHSGGSIHVPPAVVVFAVAAYVLCLAACSDRPTVFTVRDETLGTFYTLTVVDPPRGVSRANAQQIAEDALDRVDRLMSTYREDSELSQFNRHASSEPFPVSQETLQVFQVAQTISEQSGGAFDITVGPLVNAWGFGPAAFENPPDDTTVKALLKRTGYHHLEIHPDSFLVKTIPDLYCDLSAIAKGYAADAVAEALEAAGITRYMIEVGGEIRVAGKSPRNAPWVLGIETPKAHVRELYAAVHIEDGALATSGDYRNMYEVDGKLVSHTIDPHTGRPVQHALASVSVIHPSCTWADGYATALMALGPEKAEALARERNLAVLLLVRNTDENTFKAITTPAFDAYQMQRP